ncbi:MAG TPA: hypothetical protein DDZ44_08715 [Syntrophomonas wolfei]|jgi:ABC-type nitrate/sulfonate/bicarbonate transport system ATPase subunit|uniref:Uncharacterized protein n=1 Tax=Syntrophomonas wolfei TaxID=863 RepID=A0A354YXD0_9FIRM|nr:hypothetical protein [Syntrophomonas wolfei]
MILDEPGKSLDAIHTHKLMIQLARLSADEKPSIILVTHEFHQDCLPRAVSRRLKASGTKLIMNY